MNTTRVPTLCEVTLVLAFLVTEATAPAASVTACTEAGLRAAVNAGGHVTFDCDGVITFSSPIVVTQDVVVDATGRNVILSGNFATRLFEVRPAGRLVLSNLTLADGRARAGGAVYNEGHLAVHGCAVSNCWVNGLEAAPTHASPGPGSPGEGGAIWNAGVTRVSDCRFERNFAHGGGGPIAQPAPGGGVTFSPGAYAGTGGGIHNLGQLTIERSLFTNNAAVGGRGNAPIPTLGLPAGAGGDGRGGAVYNLGTASVRSSAYTRNTAYFGEGTAPADVGGASGGAFFSDGAIQITNTTIADNEVAGVPGAGGALCIKGGTADLAFVTLAYNYATGGPAGGTSRGAALYTATNATTRLTHTIVAYRRPFTTPPPNVEGPILDLGYNLGTDTNEVFTGIGSRNGVDPRLSPWGDHGGPTPTLALLDGSPAVDAGAADGLAVDDQRGLSRPFGARHDLGAVEGPLLIPVSYPLAPPVLIVGQPTNILFAFSNANRIGLTRVAAYYIPPATVNFDTNAPIAGDCPAMIESTERQTTVSGLNLAPGQTCTFPLPVRPTRSGVWPGELLGFSSDQFSTSFNNAPPAQVLGPPSPRTLPASAADFSQVTLNGQLHPGGLAALAWFEYGSTTNTPGQTTPPQAVAAGFSEAPLTATLTGLSPNTAFYYRLVGSNQLGIARGQFRTGYTLGDTVLACEEGNLAPLVARGGTVRFACDGIITLSAPLTIQSDTTLLADGHNVVLSGSNAVRLFQILPERRLTLQGLTLVHGRATNGGAIFNQGTLEASACVFSNNHVQAATALAAGGGAVWNDGISRLNGCEFVTNTALGGGGIVGVLFRTPGAGRGGGIANFGSLTLSNCTLCHNRANGGPGASSLSASGPGGPGLGGAVFNGHSAFLFNSTFHDNTAGGGTGGFASAMGSPGGDGSGGALVSTNTLTITNCTFHANQAIGGPPGRPGVSWGQGFGGALAVDGGTARLGFTTLADNHGTNAGGALLVRGNAFAELHHTLIAHADRNLSLDGPIVDRGHNLSSDAPPALTHATSLRSVEPRLGPLAFYGGGTPTLALLPTSPAIDAGDTVDVPATDQRGLPRPALAAADIGAFELQPTSYGIRGITRLGPNRYRLNGFGQPGSHFRVVGSQDTITWSALASGTVDGLGLFAIEVPGAESYQLLRTSVP